MSLHFKKDFLRNKNKQDTKWIHSKSSEDEGKLRDQLVATDAHSPYL